ncbi:hypothetical protein G8A07_21330 [Roseateles sp. DAIF2]|uniref:hypothetical protein n=1 Tax=Roseateles sp. DAIF2 TaxID=2714952 RepID=UPI0018A2BB75|nr:hypothetical protein [Roseateles sp. DAIF2]QPF75205.1 hypothetical protein G8A07_21330 [Roseateles sp. DAIF2]
MKAELSFSPSEFKVDAHDTEPVQKLVGDYIRWRWTVVALKTGEHGLGFKLYPMESSSPKELPGRVSFEGKITVVANPLLPDQLLEADPTGAGNTGTASERKQDLVEPLPPSEGRLVQMLRDNSQYLFGTVLIPLIVYLWKRYFERPKTGQPASNQGGGFQPFKQRIRGRRS